MQVTALRQSERQELSAALCRAAEHVAHAASTTGQPASCTCAAILGEGYYLAGTPAWWRLQPEELLLLQHLATHDASANSTSSSTAVGGLDMPIYLSCRPSTSQHTAAQGSGTGGGSCLPGQHASSATWHARLVSTSLSDGVHALFLIDQSPSSSSMPQTPVTGPTHIPSETSPIAASALELALPAVQRTLAGVMHLYETPLWQTTPLPQFAPHAFDLAIVVDRESSRATLLWGHSNSAPQPLGFKPLVSPTLRKQLTEATTLAASGGGMGGSSSSAMGVCGSSGNAITTSGMSPVSPRMSLRAVGLLRGSFASAGVASGAFLHASGSQGGGVAGVAGGLRPGNEAGKGSAVSAADSLQLFYRSTLDTLVSFMLQSCSSCSSGAGNPGVCDQGMSYRWWPGGVGHAAASSIPRGTSAAGLSAASKAAGQTGALHSMSTSSAAAPGHRFGLLRTAASEHIRKALGMSRAYGSAPNSPMAGARSGTGDAAMHAIPSTPGTLLTNLSTQQHGDGAIHSISSGAAGGPFQAGLSSLAGGDLQGPQRQYEEIQMVVDSLRLVALVEQGGSSMSDVGSSKQPKLDHHPGAGLDVEVFVAMQKRCSRVVAAETARAIRAVFLMSCAQEGS